MPVSYRFHAAALGAALALGFACSSPDVSDVFGNAVSSGGTGSGGAASSSSSSTSSSMTSSTSTTSTGGTTSSTSSGAVCGNMVCEPGEQATCPEDCDGACGNMVCDPGEQATCPEDCGGVCGNMVCEPGEQATCPEDCGGDCSHGVCTPGDPLVIGCDPCVDTVCGADPYCCDVNWDGICVNAAVMMCGAVCCGNGDCSGAEDCNTCPQDCGACMCGDGMCAGGEDCNSCPQDCGACMCGDGMCTGGEDCDACPQDCGACPTGSCPHSACFVRGPLNTTDCPDPCIDEVCAQTPSCCQGSPPMWDADCSAQAQALCPDGDPCVAAVCGVDPTCCTDNWTMGCVNIAMAQCGTQCNCAHSICQVGAPLTVGCNPCVDAICQVDPACCMGGWDDICRDWVPVFCGIDCG